MAKSKGQRDRLKQTRDGKYSPAESRLSWGIFDGVTKKTPTRTEKLNKNKYKPNYSQDDYNQA